MMRPKCWFILFIVIIIQVFTYSRSSPMPWVRQNYISLENTKTNSSQNSNYEHISRNKRGIDDVRLLIDLERNSLLRGDKSINIDNLDIIRALSIKENDLKRLKSEPSGDQYKKLTVEKNIIQSQDFKKITEQLELLSSLDIPYDIKSYIINGYVNKILSRADEIVDKETTTVKNDSQVISKTDHKDELNGKILEIVSSKDVHSGNLLSEEILTRDLLRKRMVNDLSADEKNTKIEAKDKVLSKPTSELEKSKSDEIKNEVKENDNKPSETKDKNFLVIIDLADKTVKTKEVSKSLQSPVDRKSNKNRNDIRIKIKHDFVNHEIDTEINQPEIRIIIKLPENKVPSKVIDEPEATTHDEVTTKSVKDDIADEINNLALTILKKIEYDTSNYPTKNLLDDIKEDVKELTMTLLRKLDDAEDVEYIIANSKHGQEKVKREVDLTHKNKHYVNWELTYNDTLVKSEDLNSINETNKHDLIDGDDYFDEIDTKFLFHDDDDELFDYDFELVDHPNSKQ